MLSVDYDLFNSLTKLSSRSPYWRKTNKHECTFLCFAQVRLSTSSCVSNACTKDILGNSLALGDPK